MSEVLTAYKDRLPLHGFCTDDFTKYGLSFQSIENMLTKALVQHNAKHSIGSLVYDIDSPTAFIDIYDRECPPPNIVAINQDNGHAHVFYMLEKPVHNYAGASPKALRWAAAVDRGLTEKLGADPGYSKLISKNPTNERWLTFFPRLPLYDLEELADWLDEKRLKTLSDLRRNVPLEGLGRNCTCFEQLRFWAYRERRREQLYLSQDMFFEACKWRGLAINQTFNPPLDHNEIRHIAKSVSKWTWRNMDAKGFKAWQKRKSIAGNKAKQKKALQLRERIIETMEQCPELSQGDIAVILGVTRQTVVNHLAAIKRGDKYPISDKGAIS